MPQITRITKWGNSQALRLSKEILHKANLQLDDTMSIHVSDGQILLKKYKPQKLPSYRSLEDIFADKIGPWEEEVVNWGKPVGAELDE